jgi:hypothetical protein
MSPVTPSVAHIRAQLSALIRTGADPERIAQVRRDLSAERKTCGIEELLTDAPELTDAHYERVRALLPPVTVRHGS